MCKILITFPTSRHAIKADNLCTKLGLRAIVVTVPEEINHECGMALEADSTLREQIESSFKSKNIPYKIYDRFTSI